MSFSYEPGAAMSDKDMVRLLIGDTDESARLLWDQEIDGLLALGSVHTAAALAARGIAGVYSRSADKEVGDLKIRYSQRAKSFLDLADKIEAGGDRVSLADISPWLGGRSKADKAAALDDTDRTDTAFSRNAFDFQPDLGAGLST